MITAQILAQNTAGRAAADAWASLLIQVDILLAGTGPDAPVGEDDALTRIAGPLTTSPMSDRPAAAWVIAIDPGQVVAVQAALARASRAYGPDVTITWTEGTPRQIPAAPADTPIAPQPDAPPAPAAQGRALRRRGDRMAQPAAVLSVDVDNWHGDVLLQGFRQERTATDFGDLIAGAIMTAHPGSTANARVVDLAVTPNPLADGPLAAPAPTAGA